MPTLLPSYCLGEKQKREQMYPTTATVGLSQVEQPSERNSIFRDSN